MHRSKIVKNIGARSQHQGTAPAHSQNLCRECSKQKIFWNSKCQIVHSGSDHVTSQFFDDLARVLEFLANQSSPLVLTGDVNVRLDRPTDSASVHFNDLLESFALTYHVTESKHRLGGILDVVVTKADDTPSSLQVDDNGLSDHHLITWSVNMRKTTAPNYVTSERRTWKNLDVAQFRSALRSSSLCTDDTTGTDLDVDEMASQYSQVIVTIPDDLIQSQRKRTAYDSLIRGTMTSAVQPSAQPGNSNVVTNAR